MDDLISARIEPSMEDDCLTDLRSNISQQGEDGGDPSMPPNLKDQISQGNLSLLAKRQINHPHFVKMQGCLLYTSPSPRDGLLSRMPSSA